MVLSVNPSAVPRAPRVDIVLRVEFESAGQLRADFLSNLSAGGMFVRTPFPFAVGQVLSLQMSLPGSIEPPATVECDVRWVASDKPEFLRGVGLAFRSLGPDLKLKIDRLLREGAAPPEPAVVPPDAKTRAVSLALLIANPILLDIIRGELERLSRGGATHRASHLTLTAVADPVACAALLAKQAVDVVVVDCAGLKVACNELVQTLRGAAGGQHVAVIVLQGPEGHLSAPPNDSRTIVLRKPVGMKSLYTTLLALSGRTH